MIDKILLTVILTMWVAHPLKDAIDEFPTSSTVGQIFLVLAILGTIWAFITINIRIWTHEDY